MPNKPDFYALAEVVSHLSNHLPRERIEIDICQGVLPIGAAIPFTAARDHISRQRAESRGHNLATNSADLDRSHPAGKRESREPSHRAQLIYLDANSARTVLREGRCSLASALYPLFLDSRELTERYALEHAEFIRPVTVEAADLVLFSFELWPYILKAGRLPCGPKLKMLDPRPSDTREHVIGEHYDIRGVLEAEERQRRSNRSMERRMRDRHMMRIQARAADSSAKCLPTDTTRPDEHQAERPRRRAEQMAWITERLKQRGCALPLQRSRGGAAGTKAEVKAEALNERPDLFTDSGFDHAWRGLPKRDPDQ